MRFWINFRKFMQKSYIYILSVSFVAGIVISIRINPHSFIPFLATVINLVLAWFVYSRDKENWVNRTFALMSLSLAVFNFDVYGLYLAPNATFAMYWCRIFRPGLLFLPPVALHFVLAFIRNKNKTKKQILYITYVIALVFTILSWAGYFEKGYIKIGWKYSPEYQLAYKIFLLNLTLFIGYALVEVFRKYRRTDSSLERNRYKYFFMAGALELIITFTNAFLSFGIKIYPFGSLGNVAYTAIIAYAIVQHQLMDIRIVIKRATVYIVLTASVTGAYFSVLFAFTNLFPGIERAVPNIIFAVLIVFGFQYFREKVQKVVDRIFYKEKYDYHKALRDFSESLTLRSVMKLNPLATSIIDNVTGTIHIENATLMVFKERKKRFEVESFKGFRKKTVEHLFLSDNDDLVKFLRKGQIPVKEEVERRLEERGYPQSGKEFQILEGTKVSLENLKSAISIPLVSKGKLVGILNLGEKMSQDMYDREDLQLLGTIANQAAIAVENAKLYEDILTMSDYTDNILKNITSGVITVDLEGRIVTLNEQAEKITGEELEEVAGKPCRKVYEGRGELGKILFDTLKREEHYVSREATLTDKEGKQVFIGVSTSLLRDSEKNKIGALAAFADLSDIKRLEEQMRRTDRLAVAGTLAAGMAHEIKNPLSSIEMFTQLLPKKFGDEKFRTKFNTIVIQELGRLNNLVEALLSFARPSQPDFRPVQVNKIMDRVLSLMEVKLFKNNVEIVKKYEDDLPEIPADEKHLIQVFMNLTLNAVEAMPEGGKLKIGARIRVGKKRGKAPSSSRVHFVGPSQYKFLEIKFTDTGKGIAPENLARLFDPFFSTKEEGTGLGLSVVHQIIEQHEGGIDAESKEGRGTTFTIQLPLEREEEGVSLSGTSAREITSPPK